MAIPLSSCFDYIGELADEDFTASEIKVHARSRGRSDDRVLVGHSPTVRFWNDRMVLIASSRSAASIRWFSFPVGDVVFRVAQAGDVLNLVRTGSGDLGLSILREDRAVLALGAIAAVPLGAHLRVANRVPEPEGPERCVQVDVRGVSQVLRARESIQVAGYDVYCERACTCHPDGPDECLAIVEAGNPTVTNAAIRSAVLLAQPWRDMLLVGEGWDGQFVRAC